MSKNKQQENNKQKHFLRRILFILLSILIASVVLYFSGGIVAGYIVTGILFDSRGSSNDDLYGSLSNYMFDMRDDFDVLNKRTVYTFKSGNNELFGYLYEPSSPKGLVITVHGIHAMADDYNAAYQAWFINHGYSVFAIDLTSHGRSDGDSIYGLHQSAYDVKAAYEYLSSEISSVKGLEITLFGHSMGAYGVLASLNFALPVRNVIALAPYNSPREMMLYEAERYVGSGLVAFAKPTFDISMNMKYGEDADLSALDGINASEANILVFQGEEDTLIPPSSASLYSHRKEVTNSHFEAVLLEDVGHEKMWLEPSSIEKAKVIMQSDQYSSFSSLLERATTKEEKDIVISNFRNVLVERASCNVINAQLFKKIEGFLQ